MIGTRRAGIVAADGCDCGTVGKINRLALHLGFPPQLGVVLDNAFHGAKHPGQGSARDRWQGSVTRWVPLE